MAVIPACWTVDNFNEPYLERHRGKPGFLQGLSTGAQQSMSFLEEFAKGHTATLRSAVAVKVYCDAHAGEALGQIRTRFRTQTRSQPAAPSEDLRN